MSGLTMGLLSLDVLSLKVLKGGGTPKERKYATKILPIVQKHHLLLVTLLLANAAAVEAMPIFLDRVSSPIVAVAVSVSAVLLFGEIIPQALCTRYGLAIGYYLSPFVRVLIFLLFIIAWPISKLLDVLLGKDHSTFFRRAELKHLVSLHEQGSQENEEPLSHDEVLIIKVYGKLLMCSC
jgi:ankyrin repeat/SOCS box protein 13/metal transporter CNNM